MRTLCGIVLISVAVLAEPIQTTHYTLHFDGPRAEADEAVRVLESAYDQFQKFFKKKLKLAKGEKLVVRFVKELGDGRQGGYYDPESKTARLVRQPTRYGTRALLIKQACHQYHFLARTGNKAPAAAWYTEGLAEYLAFHHWDGETLTLGVAPTVDPRDFPDKALKLAKDPAFNLQHFVEGQQHAESRALGWALCRYLVTEQAKKVQKWARKMDGGNQPGPLFKKTFGREMQAPFVKWLETQQQAWVQIHPEWQPVGPDALRAFSPRVSACRPKGAIETLQVTLVAPPRGKRWKAGILLHYTSDEDYTVFLIDWGGFVDIKRRVGKSWKPIERGPGPPKPQNGLYKLQAFRKKGKVYVMIGNDGYGPWELPGNNMGLCIERCEVTFRTITWK